MQGLGLPHPPEQERCNSPWRHRHTEAEVRVHVKARRAACLGRAPGARAPCFAVRALRHAQRALGNDVSRRRRLVRATVPVHRHPCVGLRAVYCTLDEPERGGRMRALQPYVSDCRRGAPRHTPAWGWIDTRPSHCLVIASYANTNWRGTSSGFRARGQG